jgi:UDP-N-acetylmuramoyl-L-alanyl-D-glutamate--2,6-diaminopimelate ligase
MKLSALIGMPAAEDFEIRNAVDDSRLVEAGDVFIIDSRQGPDAETYVKMALERGAAYIISDDFYRGPRPSNLLLSDRPGAYMAKWAAARWPRQPKHVLGVTGTNGKTSTAWFARELATLAGRKAASLGTLGLYENNDYKEYFGFTSPRPAKLHTMLDDLAGRGFDHVAMEVSSHALDLGRMEAVRFTACAFTNLTQDHLDFHGSMDGYFRAKQRLFAEVMHPGSTAVINVGRMESMPLLATAKGAGLNVLTYGTANAELVVRIKDFSAAGMDVEVKYDRWHEVVTVPLVGLFQGENLGAAIGLALAAGLDMGSILTNLTKLSPVPGRMEAIVTANPKQPTVVVDYAHTPDALKSALESLRPQVKGKLWVVFGCGGNRDKTKRPLMGRISKELADRVVVTDDNPRFEEPDVIRGEIMAAATGADNIGDRRKAIEFALRHAAGDDVVLITGKGPESGQIVKGVTTPFDDREVAREILEQLA